MLDMTSWLIRSGLSNWPSRPVRAKVDCCKSCDHFSCQVIDDSATRILSSRVTSCQPQMTGGLICFSYPSAVRYILHPQSTGLLPRQILLVALKKYQVSSASHSVVHHLYKLFKSIHSCQIVPHVIKILQNFWLNLVLFLDLFKLESSSWLLCCILAVCTLQLS